MRTLEELEHTSELIERLKDDGKFEEANELFQKFVSDALLMIVMKLQRNRNETETIP